MRQGTNYNKTDRGYTMPGNKSTLYILGCLMVVYTVGNGLTYRDDLFVDLVGTILIIVAIVSTILSLTLASLSGKYYYMRDKQFTSRILLCFAIACVFVACVCRMYALPGFVDSSQEVYNLVIKSVLDDVLLTSGIIFAYHAAKIYLWPDFKNTIQAYARLNQAKTVLSDYRQLLVKLYEKEAYYEKLKSRKS